MNEIHTTVIGNLTRDPDLRVTDTGTSVTRISLATTARRYDRQAGGYVDGTTTFLDGTLFGHDAEHAAQSLRKGHRVIAVGRLVTRVYTPQQGPNAGTEQRRLELVVEEIGPSLRFAEADIHKTTTPSAAATSRPPTPNRPSRPRVS